MADDEQVFQDIVSNITNVLITASDARNKAASTEATHQYQEWEQNYFPMWLTALAVELADESKGKSKSRELAGILLRNCFVGREDTRRDFVLQRWQSVPLQARNEIKNRLLMTMQHEEQLYRHKAAEAAAQIAILDLPTDSWKGVIAQFSSGVTSAETSDVFKEACLIALKEICVATDPNILAHFSVDILLAIITGMDSPHIELQLQATKALAAAIQFSDANFANPEQRTAIIGLVLKLTESPNDHVRLEAFTCLATIAEAYYTYLPDHMTQGVYKAILDCISGDPNEEIVMQAINFWSNICEEETNIFRENQQAAETQADLLPCHNFVQGAIGDLTEPLFNLLAKGDDDPELTTWTVASAASSCISLIATTLGNDVVDHFVPFISANVAQPDPKLREAAVLCFGAIMDGPGTEAIAPVINEALPCLFERLVDEADMVKKTTAWCLARIALFHPYATNNHLLTFLQAVCNSLHDAPWIAESCAEAIENLAEHVTPEERAKSPLTPFLSTLFGELVTASDRTDTQDASFRISVYAAIRALVRATPDEQLDLIVTALDTYEPRLQDTIGGIADPELQGELIGITAACVRRIGSQLPVERANQLMELYIQLLRSRDGDSSIYQEIFMAIGAIADAVGPHFNVYMEEFYPFLEIGLNQWRDADLCNQSVILTTALCFTLGPDFKPFADPIIKIYLDILAQPDVPQSLPPVIVNGFADVAYALGSEFFAYLNPVMEVLGNYQKFACVRTEDMSEWEDIERVIEWRSSLLLVFSLVLQSCGEHHANALLPHVSSMSKLLSNIMDDRRREDVVNRYACGLIYDMANTFPDRKQVFVRFDPFLLYCKQSAQSHPRTRDMAQNAIDKLHS